MLNNIKEFLLKYRKDNEYIDDRHIFIKDINTAIDTIEKIKKSNIDDTLKQIDAKINTVRFKNLLKNLIDIVKKYFDNEITLPNAKKSLEDKANKYQNEDYNLPRGLLEEQLTYIYNEIEKIIPSEEDKKQVDFALEKIGDLISNIKNSSWAPKINIHTASSPLRKYKGTGNEAELMNKILNTVFIKMTNNVEPEILSKLVKDYTNSVLAPYKVDIPESGKITFEGDISESGEITSKKKSKTNYLTILYWILVAIVVIIGILIALGLILGFIYAIRAERFKETWSTKRVIGRTLLGFAFVAMYWNRYGIW